MRALGLLVAGVLFGAGLAISGLFDPDAVLAFLRLQDLGLLVTMGAGIAVAWVGYGLLPRRLPRPWRGAAFDAPQRAVGRHHVLGAIVFGIGWGVSGMCPGAAVAGVGALDPGLLVGVVGIALGAYLQGLCEPPSHRG